MCCRRSKQEANFASACNDYKAEWSNWENHLNSNPVSPKDSWQNVGALTEHKRQLEGIE